jgi:hypothetical protein
MFNQWLGILAIIIIDYNLFFLSWDYLAINGSSFANDT